MSFLFTIFLNALALFIVTQLLGGFHLEGGWLAYVIAGAVISILNALVKPVLKLVAFPLVFLTAGLFLIVINALILFLTQHLLEVMDISGMALVVDNLLTYFLAALIFGLANSVLNWFLKE